jgi:hypothetical protein
MYQLRDDATALSVDGFDDCGIGLQSIVAVEPRISRMGLRCRMFDRSDLGDEQAGPGPGASLEIVDIAGLGYAIVIKVPSHGRHDDPVLQVQALDLERLEQGGEVHLVSLGPDR